MKIILTTICIAMSLLLIIYAAQKNEPSQQANPRHTIGVVLKAMDSEHWMTVYSSMQKEAQQRGVNLIVLWPDNESSYEEQNHIITDLINNGVDALIVSSCNIYETEDFLKLARQKQIPVFSLDEKLDDTIYIGADNYLIGTMAARYMQQHLPPGSQVGSVSGSNVQNAHILRVQGFKDYITGHTNLHYTENLADDVKYRQAAVQTEKMLRDYPAVKGIFVTSALMALSASEVVSAVNPAVSVVGVDTQNDAVMAVKNQKISAMISQDGRETGALAVKVAADYLDKHAAQPTDNYIKSELITIDNADNYLIQEDF